MRRRNRTLRSIDVERLAEGAELLLGRSGLSAGVLAAFMKDLGARLAGLGGVVIDARATREMS